MSTNRGKDALDMVKRVLEEQGATFVASVITGSNHQKIVFEIAGQRRFIITSLSPSDRRSIRNIAATTRKVCTQLRGGIGVTP